MKSIGIDPGTKSFDIVVMDEEKIIEEKSIPTEIIASNPDILIDEILKIKDFDVIIAPSGYGSPFVCNENIKDIRLFASEILLLSKYKELLNLKDEGSMVYKALYKTSIKLWKNKINACYIPSVKLLNSVELKFKINTIDCGTADKLASAFYVINYLRDRESFDIDKINFTMLEIGYGYNALIKVRRGRIVGGIGGTKLGIGHLTIGPIDAEITAYKRRWKRNDIFYGGLKDYCKTSSLDDALKSTEPICRAAVEQMFDSIFEKILILNEDTKDILVVTGRYSSSNELKEKLSSNLSKKFERIIFHPKYFENSFVKESALGQAMIGLGFMGSKYKETFDVLGIKESKGTVLDYIMHPKILELRERLLQIYEKALVNR